MNRKIIILSIIATLVFLTGVQEAMSRQGNLIKFEQNYPETVSTRIDTCVICHLVVQNTTFTRNPYGIAYGNSGNFKLIEMNDSDGDGYSNIQEIRNLTFPGDASDKPGSLNPNITAASPMAVQATAVVTQTPDVTTVAKTPGFEIVLTVIALLAIFMGFKKRFV